MKRVHELKGNGFYLFESLSSANSKYFQDREEIMLFRNLITRYLKKYVRIVRFYVDVHGYHMVLRLRQSRTICRNYEAECEKRGKLVKLEFLENPWKVISEKMRIMKSVYVKLVNKKRGREGVLVKENYGKYYFETEAEYDDYIAKMEKGEEIKSQTREEYRVKRSGKLKDWVKLRAVFGVVSVVGASFQDLVLPKLIKLTKSFHSQPT